jgi:hypothetical protein
MASSGCDFPLSVPKAAVDVAAFGTESACSAGREW